MSIIVAERFLNNDAFRCDDGQRKEILRFGFQSSHEEYQNGIRFYHGNLIPHLHQVCGAVLYNRDQLRHNVTRTEGKAEKIERGVFGDDLPVWDNALQQEKNSMVE